MKYAPKMALPIGMPATVLTGCEQAAQPGQLAGQRPESGALRVTTTIGMIGDVARELGGALGRFRAQRNARRDAQAAAAP